MVIVFDEDWLGCILELAAKKKILFKFVDEIVICV